MDLYTSQFSMQKIGLKRNVNAARRTQSFFYFIREKHWFRFNLKFKLVQLRGLEYVLSNPCCSKCSYYGI